jgi:cell wall-associated NlpC family hydrolase
MKNLFILLFLLTEVTGCSVFRPATQHTDNLSDGNSGSSGDQKTAPVFIDNISTGTSGHSSKTVPITSDDAPLREATPAKTLISPESKDYYEQLQFKYAILTNTPVEQLTNQRLLIFMDDWYGAPYHYGGTTRDGIDCSAFTCLLQADVYNVRHLPRMSHDQFTATRRISRKDLREGDLVFFHTLGKGHRVTHVGVYLYNNRFVHASIAGVQISDLGEGYYMQHYVGAGRPKAE